jgi:LSD1 subclass zinc finger protein
MSVADFCHAYRHFLMLVLLFLGVGATTQGFRQVKCSKCQTANVITFIISTNRFGGSPDLDGRPPEMERSTISKGVHRCSKCGYASSDIEAVTALPASFLESKEYLDASHDPTLPQLARDYVCAALCLIETSDHQVAARRFLSAAWACDDALGPHSEPGKACRRRSLDAYARMKAAGSQVSDKHGTDELIQIDMLRRIGEFEKAIAFAQEARKMGLEHLPIQIIDAQIKLAAAKDADVHKMDVVRDEI